MIATLPDPEIQRAEELRRQLQPKNKFAFLWDVFYSRRKFKLSREELAELEGIENNLSRWATACGRIYETRQDPQAAFDRAAGRYLAEPTDENFHRMLAHNFSQPNLQILLGRAAEQFERYLNGERQRLFPPLVKKYLVKIHDSLVLEYHEQAQADEKSLKRLEGIASGGESQSCIELRVAAARIAGLLESGDLTNWREALGPFLP